MKIRIDDLNGPEIAALLEEHIADMRRISPPESKHALDLNGLRQPEITFWTIWQDEQLAGCGALKQLEPTHGEIKSMRTASAFRRQGIASQMLTFIIEEAKHRHYTKLSLETGAMPFFAPARELYQHFGFINSTPFADYKEDPNSVFMQKNL
jgi:putative acetyltransferase